MRAALFLPLLSFGVAAAAAAAPPALVSSSPANAAPGNRPEAVRLVFDQAVLADGTHFTLKMTAALWSNMDQPIPIAITAVNHDGPDKLDLGVGRPLALGRYELAWSVTNPAGEAANGTIQFDIR